jgi:hypothetical protein
VCASTTLFATEFIIKLGISEHQRSIFYMYSVQYMSKAGAYCIYINGFPLPPDGGFAYDHPAVRLDDQSVTAMTVC